MEERLRDKVAVITGASAGIGHATARRFADEGACVVLLDIDEGGGRSAEAGIRSNGADALFVRTDITDEASVVRAFEEVDNRHGRLDVLFNCAGGSLPQDGTIIDSDLSVLDHSLSLDLRGTFLCSRHGIPRMIASGGGSIINMSSIAALRGARVMHAYGAAKGAVISLSRSLAATYGQEGIRVNTVCPGLVLSERMKRRDMHVEAIASTHPFAVGTPENIAAIVTFLVSDEAA